MIACSPDIIYKALIDYNAWREWVPSLASARLLTREDMLAIVELGMDSKDAEPLMMECIETPRRNILARVIEGKSSMHEMEWSIEAADAGSAGQRNCKAQNRAALAQTRVMAGDEPVKVPRRAGLVGVGSQSGTWSRDRRGEYLRALGD